MTLTIEGSTLGPSPEVPRTACQDGGISRGQQTSRGEPPVADAAWAVVLAGGEGRRLRGIVRQVLGSDRPKQFCRLVGSRSMLRHTWDRALRLVEPERIVTIITAGQERYLDEEVARGVPGTVLVQPQNKETAPGLLLPLLWIARRAPWASVAVLPADHFVWDEERFAASVRAALAAAEYWPDRLVLLGVEAEDADVGYGWISPGAPVAPGPGPDLYAVQRFWEKPDQQTAARFLACGCLWNTMVLAGHLQTYLRLAAATVPEILEPLSAVRERLEGPAEGDALRAAYTRVPPTNLSEATLARHPEALMVLAARGIGWSDWGEAERILRSLRRFSRRPSWLPAYARAQGAPAGG